MSYLVQNNNQYQMKISVEWKESKIVIEKVFISSQISFAELQAFINNYLKDIPNKLHIYCQRNCQFTLVKDQQTLNNVILKHRTDNPQSNQTKNIILKFILLENILSEKESLANQQIEALSNKIEEIQIENTQSISVNKNTIESEKQKTDDKIESVIKRFQKIKIQEKGKEERMEKGKRIRTNLKKEDKSSDSSDSLSYSDSPQKMEQEFKVIHKNTSCTKCKAKPILGVRWKCTICTNYDLCEKCQKIEEHVHCLLKIRNPGQTPSEILNQTVLKGSSIKWDFSADLQKLGHKGQLENQVGKKQVKQAKKKKKNEQLGPQIINDVSFQAIIISKAHELSQLLEVPIDQCLIVSQKNPFKDISELVEEYFRKQKNTN